MIKSKQDYLFYLEADKTALGGAARQGLLSRLVSPHPIYKFQKLLRKCEYYKNCKKDMLSKVYYVFLKRKFKRMAMGLGFSMHENNFGPGLAIVHYGTIVINANARIGANCRIHPSTCIGASGGSPKAPVIGDNVYIAPGVKIYGDITLASNIATAANAAVGSSFEEENIMIGGVPAKKIKEIDITKIITHIKK